MKAQHNQHVLRYTDHCITNLIVLRDRGSDVHCHAHFRSKIQRRIDELRGMLVTDALAQVGDYNTVIRERLI